MENVEICRCLLYQFPCGYFQTSQRSKLMIITDVKSGQPEPLQHGERQLRRRLQASALPHDVSLF